MARLFTSSERSLGPSDTEPGSPEVAVCYGLRVMVEKDDEDNEQEISENGQEVLGTAHTTCI